MFFKNPWAVPMTLRQFPGFSGKSGKTFFENFQGGLCCEKYSLPVRPLEHPGLVEAQPRR